MPDNKINVEVFCNWQGLSNNDRFVLNKKYPSSVEKTYNEWYDELENLIVLGERKTFAIEESVTIKKQK